MELDLQNPDIFTPPETDHAMIPSLKYSFGMAHNRLEGNGWAREITIRELPISKSMAVVNMRLGPGAVRELHWHKEAEWAFITQGKVRFTVVDHDLNVSVDDLEVGDLWLVPKGIPHSIQGLEGGGEFILVFDDGNFSENETLLVTEFMAHMPRSVLAKNFEIPEEAFKNIPPREKYIFGMPVPASLDTVRGQLPNKPPPKPFVYKASKQPFVSSDGGASKKVDFQEFPETTISLLMINVEPGALREIHWHPDADEVQYYSEGEARMTVFDATDKARTFNYRAGDVGFVPRTMGHYIENIGSTNLQVISAFNSPQYKEISLNQWLALTPPELVRGHLNVDDTFMHALRRETKRIVR